MSEASTELCQWDVPNCPKAAALHVSWDLGNGSRREKHLCESHTSFLREKPRNVEARPIKYCTASCPIVLANL